MILKNNLQSNSVCKSSGYSSIISIFLSILVTSFIGTFMLKLPYLGCITFYEYSFDLMNLLQNPILNFFYEIYLLFLVYCLMFDLIRLGFILVLQNCRTSNSDEGEFK